MIAPAPGLNKKPFVLRWEGIPTEHSEDSPPHLVVSYKVAEELRRRGIDLHRADSEEITFVIEEQKPTNRISEEMEVCPGDLGIGENGKGDNFFRPDDSGLLIEELSLQDPRRN